MRNEAGEFGVIYLALEFDPTLAESDSSLIFEHDPLGREPWACFSDPKGRAAQTGSHPRIKSEGMLFGIMLYLSGIVALKFFVMTALPPRVSV